MKGHAHLCGLLILVLIQTGYGAHNRRDDASPMSVITLEEPPYVIVKDPSKSGNDNFEGFVPDLLEEISQKMRVGYQMRGGDDKYGERQPNTQTWDGMVGKLQRKTADVAAAPITVSDDRKEAIDFAEPFMDVELSVLYKKNGEQRPFDTLQELSEMQDTKVGLVKGGMTENVFKKSGNATFQAIWRKVEASPLPGGRLTNNEAGQKSVRQSGGDFVFIMEGTTADYYKNQKPCELDTLPIGMKSQYAFGLKKGSEFKEGINKAIKELKASGRIQELKDKWWKGECVPRDKGISQHTSMTSASLVFLGVLLYLMS